MNRTPAVTTGLVICALLGALNVTAGLTGLTADGAPPAWRGSRGGLLLVVASRAAAALLAAPALFVDESDSVRVVVAIAIAVTLVGIWLLVATLRRTPARVSG